MSLVKLQIKNRSRHDYPAFVFGVTLPEEHKVIKVECFSKDRFHKFLCQQSPSAASSLHVLDFVCEPFNRNDELRVTFYVTSLAGIIEKDQIQVATAAPVAFVSGSDEGTKPEPSIKGLVWWLIAGILFSMFGVVSSLYSIDQLGRARDKTEKRIEALEYKQDVKKLIEAYEAGQKVETDK